jgi:MHS family proline/betaine transporter-like MFS transporter
LTESINSATILLIILFSLANGGARAIGGWFFGKKGDQKGRLFSFPLTLLIATLPSWSIAILSFVLPFDYWETYSIVIFLFFKFFQGIPAGGEIPGAICYLSESYAYNLKSDKIDKFMCSYALVGPQIGIILSTFVCLILKEIFPIEYLNDYAWRYIFTFSGMLGIVGYLMRRKLHETAAYLNLKAHHLNTASPIKELFTKNKSKLSLVFFLSIFEVVAVTIITFLPFIFTNSPFFFKDTSIIFFTFYNSFLFILLLPIIGFLSSKTDSFPWFSLSIWGTILFSILLYFSVINGYCLACLIINSILVFLISIQSALLPSVLSEIFPTRIRYSGIAFSFNICDGIFWSAFVGICSLFTNANNPFFILILAITALSFPITRHFIKKNKKIYSLLK